MHGLNHLSLTKECLIRKRAEYLECYDIGRKVHTRHFLLFVAPPAESDEGVRLGTAVSRKIGTAVVRNRIKRIVRESFRLEIRHLPIRARLVVVAKREAGKVHLTMQDVLAELGKALARHFHLGEDNASQESGSNDPSRENLGECPNDCSHGSSSGNANGNSTDCAGERLPSTDGEQDVAPGDTESDEERS